MTMGDRVAVIRKGTLQQVDTPRALYDHPVNIFVGGFIGSPAMNFVYGTLQGEGDAVFASFGGQRLRIAPELLAHRPGLTEYAGKDIVIGLRPEIFFNAEPTTPDDQSLPATVVIIEQLGSEAYVHFDVEVPPVVTPDIQELLADQGQDPSVLGDLTKFTAKVDPDRAPKMDDQIRLSVDTTKLHFFDRATGSAIY
jgi:multiple sugar transport system ATP-binding protein